MYSISDWNPKNNYYLIIFCLSEPMILWAAGTKLAQNFREKWLLPAGKLGRSDSKIGRSYSAKLRHFLSIKKQISHYTYYCHLMEGETQYSCSRLSDNGTTACICVVTEWKWVSLRKKKKNFFFFFGETPTSPWVPFRAKFRPLERLVRPSRPLAWSLGRVRVKNLTYI